MPKELQYLSQRRKNQLICRELTKPSELPHPTNSIITCNIIEAEKSNSNNDNSNNGFTNDDTFNENEIISQNLEVSNMHRITV